MDFDGWRDVIVTMLDGKVSNEHIETIIMPRLRRAKEYLDRLGGTVQFHPNEVAILIVALELCGKLPEPECSIIEPGTVMWWTPANTDRKDLKLEADGRLKVLYLGPGTKPSECYVRLPDNSQRPVRRRRLEYAEPGVT